MIGAYYYHLDVDSTNRDLRVGIGMNAPVFPPFSNIFNEGLINEASEQTENYALFAAVDFDLTPTLHLSLSGRYSWEEKEVMATYTFAISLNSATFSDSAVIFVSVSRAVKAGRHSIAVCIEIYRQRGHPVQPSDR